MKKIGLLIMLFAIGLSSTMFAQTRQGSSKQDGIRKTETTTTVFVQINASESLDSPEAKIQAVLGRDNQFYVKDKRDFEIYDVLVGEVGKFSLLPDALNYLAERGFVIETFSSNTVGDRVRHTVILSRTTTM